MGCSWIGHCLGIAAECFEFGSPVVEFGSRLLDQRGDYRRFFPHAEYIGCDIADGPNVDRVEDVQATSFADATAGSVICTEVLEHVPDPFAAVREMSRILRPGGLVFLSAPMHHTLHAYPADYWRFTPQGFQVLLNGFSRREVWYEGYAAYPNTVFALAWKAPPPGDLDARLSTFAARIRPSLWQRARNAARAYLVPEGFRGRWWRRRKWRRLIEGTLNDPRRR